jgi:hypothetical protein
MTPAEEARFIELWNTGTEQAAMGRQLGIPRGTVSSRAYALQRQGKIQPRPRGGAYPMQRRQATLAGVSNDTSRVSTGVSARTPPPDERGKSIRWNLHLSEGLRKQIKAMAKTRGLQDSQMVEELLWLALSVVVEESPIAGAG